MVFKRGLSFFIAGLWSTTALSQTAIVTDGTLGERVELSQKDARISADLGQIVGKNLFHSFAKFDIGSDASAAFEGPADIASVIARVTGGGPSQIDGTLRSTVGNADLWLINPAGVMFGKGAAIDVPGDFHVATADHIGFADGSKFGTSRTEASALTVARPESFGFLGALKDIAVDGATLSVRQGRALSIVAGEIDIGESKLEAESGSLVLVSNSAAGSVLPDDPNVPRPLGGRIEIVGSSLSTGNPGTANAGRGIHIEGGELIVGDDARLASEARGSGDAGPIGLFAQELTVARTAIVSTNTEAGGRGGDIRIEARRLLIDGEVSSRSVGPQAVLLPNEGAYYGAGAVVVEVDSDFGEDSPERARGDAGDISITAYGGGTLELGGRIVTDTNGDGIGGSVTVMAGTVLVVDEFNEASDIDRTGDISSSAGARGDAGSISIDVGPEGAIVVAGGIRSTASGSGDAGRLTLAGGDIEITGELSTSTYGNEGGAGSIAIDARQFRLEGGAIYSEAVNDGYGDLAVANAGSISIAARESVSVSRYSQISSQTSANGDAGSIVLTAPKIEIDGIVTSSAGNVGYRGQGGTVTIDAGLGDLQLHSNAQVLSRTLGDGDAGRIILNAENLGIAGRVASASIAGSSYRYSPDGFEIVASLGEGAAGSIAITAGSLVVLQGASIASTTQTIGDAGNISIEALEGKIEGSISSAADLVRFDYYNSSRGDYGQSGGAYTPAFSEIRTYKPLGGAGRVAIRISEDPTLADGADISSSSSGYGVAGDIELSATRLDIEDAIVQTSSLNAGGRIDLAGSERIVIDNSTITTSGSLLAEDASLLSVSAPLTTINRTRMFSLTGDDAINPENVFRTGRVDIQSELTIVSIDSEIAAGTEVTISGLDSELGTDAVLLGAVPSEVARLANGTCIAGNAQYRSSLTTSSSRTSRHDQPDSPLGNSHRVKDLSETC